MTEARIRTLKINKTYAITKSKSNEWNYKQATFTCFQPSPFTVIHSAGKLTDM